MKGSLVLVSSVDAVSGISYSGRDVALGRELVVNGGDVDLARAKERTWVRTVARRVRGGKGRTHGDVWVSPLDRSKSLCRTQDG